MAGAIPLDQPERDAVGEAFFIGGYMLTLERAKYFLDYDPETGLFCSKIRANRRAPGIITGPISHYGYLIIGIDGEKYKAHRLAWFFVHGEFPDGMIDHRNEIKTDNRISNLRIASHFLNQHNRFKSKEHKLLGAYFHKSSGKWSSSIKSNKKLHYLGLFDTELEAHNRYMEAKKEYHADAY